MVDLWGSESRGLHLCPTFADSCTMSVFNTISWIVNSSKKKEKSFEPPSFTVECNFLPQVACTLSLKCTRKNNMGSGKKRFNSGYKSRPLCQIFPNKHIRILTLRCKGVPQKGVAFFVHTGSFFYFLMVWIDNK